MRDTEYERPAHWTDDDVLRDLHARWHDQPGNLIGEGECGWNGCEFWDAAKFVADTVGLATTGGETAEITEQIKALPVGSVVRTPDGFVYWVPVDPNSPETTERQS